MTKDEMLEVIRSTVLETLSQLGISGGNVGNVPTQSMQCGQSTDCGRTAYEKTELLLANYVGFKRIVDDRLQEAEDIRQYGVPQTSCAFDFSPHTNVVRGIVLPEVSVDDAIKRVVASVQGTVEAIAFVDRGLERLKADPYYQILPMRYFEGRTQEDIAYTLGCTQKTISQNKCRLLRELAMQLFPDQVANEMMS